MTYQGNFMSKKGRKATQYVPSMCLCMQTLEEWAVYKHT
jgi:hypothetical protein